MYTLKKNVIHELIVKNSKFITLLIKVNTQEDILRELENIKKQYKDATHYCYAYLLDEKQKACDDNEPNGTAGIPILNVLKKNHLNHILCVVVRYFGGIKLGSGGLIRSYSKSVTESIKSENLVELVNGYQVSFSLSYSEYQKLENLFKTVRITKQSFLEQIHITAIVSEDDLEILKTHQVDCEVLSNQLIEKEF